MNLFWTLLQKLIPLYLLVGLGFVASRYLKVRKEDIATLLIYLIGPGVVFSAVLSTPLTLARLSLPFLFFVLCGGISLGVFFGARQILSVKHRSIASFACASANTGFFGIPLTLYLLGADYVGLTILCALGFILFENSLGFYLAARGNSTVRESLQKVIRLPTLYAFFLGVFCNLMGLHLEPSWQELSTSFRGCYSILGMFMVGLGAGSLRTLRANPRFISVAFAVKFIVWPLLVFLVLLADRHWFHFYDPQTRRLLPLIAIVPMPAISVAYATVLDTEPEDVAVAVLGSTIFALVYVPVICSFNILL